MTVDRVRHEGNNTSHRTIESRIKVARTVESTAQLHRLVSPRERSRGLGLLQRARRAIKGDEPL
jgi:hypothetical protein